MQREKAYFNWSTDKASALALYYVLNEQRYDVQYLLTSVNGHHHRLVRSLRRELFLAISRYKKRLLKRSLLPGLLLNHHSNNRVTRWSL